MQELVKILRQNGFSQEWLSGWLGVSRQMIMKIEKGSSFTNTDVLLKLTQLHECIAAAPLTTDKQETSNYPGLQEQSREKECRFAARVLQRKLEKYESDFIKCKKICHALETLKADNESDKLWIRRTKQKIIDKLDLCSLATRMSLRKRVYLLTAEADYISNMST